MALERSTMVLLGRSRQGALWQRSGPSQDKMDDDQRGTQLRVEE